MEITLENKAKLFAHYWGQEVVFHRNSRPLFITFESLINSVEVIDGYAVYLKPLSSIGDEDLLQVSKIVYPTSENWSDMMQTISRGLDFIEETFHSDEDEFSVFGIKKPLYKIMSVIDYLRSKGYALPLMGLSVEQMVEAGWIKLAE